MYISLPEVKKYLKIDSSDDDSLLVSFISDAQSAVDSFCLRTFEAAADSTRYFDALRDVDGRRLKLDRDLCAITSITNGDGATVTTGQYTTLPRNDTPFYAIQLKASSGINWQWENDPEGAIAVTGRWAYSTTVTDKFPLAFVCKRLVAYFYHQRGNNADLDRAVVVGNSTLLPASLPADIQKLLLPARRGVAA